MIGPGKSGQHVNSHSPAATSIQHRRVVAPLALSKLVNPFTNCRNSFNMNSLNTKLYFLLSLSDFGVLWNSTSMLFPVHDVLLLHDLPVLLKF